MAEEQPTVDQLFKKYDLGDFIAPEIVTKDLLRLDQLIAPDDVLNIEKLNRLKCWNQPASTPTEISQALNYSTQAIRDIPLNASAQYHTDLTLCQAFYLQLSGDVKSAFEGFNRGIESAYEIEELKLIADGRSLRGFLYSYIGNFSAALNDLITAQELYESLHLSGWANYNLNAIATSFRRYGDPKTAIDYYTKLKETYLNNKQNDAAIFVTRDIGFALEEQGEYQQALEHFLIVYGYFKEQQQANSAATITVEIASNLIKLNKQTKEEHYLTKAEQYLSEAEATISTKDPTVYSFMQFMIAETKLLRGHYEAALKALNKSEQSFRSIQNDRGLIKLLQLKSDIHIAMNDYPAAHQALLEFVELNKKIDSNLLEQQTTELKIKFNTDRISSENNKLIENQKLKEQELALLQKNKSLQYIILLLTGSILIIVSLFAFLQVRRNRQLNIAALTDDLTKLPNRRHIYTKALCYLEQTAKHHSPFSVFIADADHFKQVNDNFGHEVGDRALICIANAGRKLTDNKDHMGRIGGEEFLMLLPNTDATAAKLLAEQLQANITQLSQQELPPTLKLTISIGIATLAPANPATDAPQHPSRESLNKEFSNLLKRADKALYTAKNAGRNCVKSAE
ncbi:MAG: tetratricopeptide repeat-containing diguanylate cyclase [Shewanella sp.]